MKKLCSICNVEKDISEFGVRKRHGKDVVESYCIECRRATKRRDYQKHKEKRKAQVKRWYQNNVDRINKRGKKYREENKEAIAAQKKKYREEHREEISERKKKYHQEHREEVLERAKKYREENKEKVAEGKARHYQNNKEAVKERVRNYYQDRPLKHTWYNLQRRCYNPENKMYKFYGERGITVCDEWLNNYEAFEKWCLDNGWRKGMHLHRVDNDGPYSPDNVKIMNQSDHSKYHAAIKDIEKANKIIAGIETTK